MVSLPRNQLVIILPYHSSTQRPSLRASTCLPRQSCSPTCASLTGGASEQSAQVRVLRCTSLYLLVYAASGTQCKITITRESPSCTILMYSSILYTEPLSWLHGWQTKLATPGPRYESTPCSRPPSCCRRIHPDERQGRSKRSG